MRSFKHFFAFTGYTPNFPMLGKVVVVAVLIFTLTVPVSLTLAPQKADAASIVIECCANLATNIITTIKNVAKVLKEFGLDTIAWVIAQKLIQKMAADIVKWAQRGFDGAPAFATDFEGLLLDTANAVAGDFILGTKELAWLCSPYSFNIRFTLAIQVQQFRDRTPKCTLTGVIDRLDDFLSGDFLSGGWDGWFKLTQQPTNNIYGSFLTAQAGLTSQLGKAQERKINLLDWGHGFLGWTECPSGTQKVKQGQTETCVGGDADGNEIRSEPITQTPGKVIEDQVNKALDYPKKKLVTADEINEIIGAIASQLVSMAFESAGGLFKADSRRPGTRTSILDQLRGERPENYQAQQQPNEAQIRADLNQQFDREQANLRYSLSSESSLLRVRPGGTRSTVITKTLLSGAGRGTSITVSNAGELEAKGITFLGTNLTCLPTCTATAVISTTASTPPGQYSIVVTGDPLPEPQSITITLEVTSAADTSAPTVSSIIVTDDLHVNVTASDDFGVTRIELRIETDGTTVATLDDISFPLGDFDASSYLNSPGSTYTLTATAFDAAGQASVPLAVEYTSPAAAESVSVGE